jgi:hypothetical protein
LALDLQAQEKKGKEEVKKQVKLVVEQMADGKMADDKFKEKVEILKSLKKSKEEVKEEVKVEGPKESKC